MPKSCIPGYEDALEAERKLREEIFLGVNPRICGIEIQHLTPFLLARLYRMETAFFGNGEVTPAEIVRFLWAMSPAFSIDLNPPTPWYRKLLGKRRIPIRDAFIDGVTKRLDDFWDIAEDQIDKYLSDTFLDSPTGGVEAVPYVTGIAWMVYAMAKEPFRWDSTRTLHTPLRVLYQLMRCAKLDAGVTLYNKRSDQIKADWLDELNLRTMGGNN